MDVTILYDRVLLKMIENENVSVGGIVLAGAGNDNTRKAEVVKVGEGKQTKDGTLIPLTIKVGEIVIFDPTKVIPVKIEGQDLIVIREDDIFCVVN